MKDFAHELLILRKCSCNWNYLSFTPPLFCLKRLNECAKKVAKLRRKLGRI